MTNYERLMEHMKPEAMACLLSQGIFINSCMVCTRDGNTCDGHCEEHILEWLNSDKDEKVVKLIKYLSFVEDIL